MLKNFIYMFDTEKNKKHFFVLYLFVLITFFCFQFAAMQSPVATLGNVKPIFYILLFISYLLVFVPIGYGVLILKALKQKQDVFTFPDFDYISIYKAGLKAVVSFLLYMLMPVAAYLLLDKIYRFAIDNNIIVLSFLILAFMILSCFIFSFFIPALISMYAVKDYLLTGFRFRYAKDIINKNISRYCLSYIIILVLSILLLVLKFAILQSVMPYGKEGVFVYVTLFSFFITYLMLVIMRICVYTSCLKQQ